MHVLIYINNDTNFPKKSELLCNLWEVPNIGTVILNIFYPMRTLSCLFQLMIFIEQPAEISVHLLSGTESLCSWEIHCMWDIAPICAVILWCESVCVYVCECTERCLTFPLCWEQIRVVPLPGRASSTVHSSLLLSGEACCASMRLEGVTASTIQGCRKHKPERNRKKTFWDILKWELWWHIVCGESSLITHIK